MIEKIHNVLACDVGNSTIRLAHVRGDEVSPTRTLRIGDLSALGRELAEVWDEIPPVRKLVAGSVSPVGLKALEAAAAESLGENVLVIGRDLPLPIETHLRHPEQIGVDRLCAAVAAFDRLGVPCAIADIGTAVTVDCVDAEGKFLGGAILPGLALSAECLHTGTAELPRVDLTSPDWVYGRDTREAIVGGLVYGARGAIRALVEAYATDLGQWPLVIATGGDAELVVDEAAQGELVQAIVPDLVLRGIAIAYYKVLLR